MMSMMLLVLHAAQATSEARARPEEEKPQSERPARPGAEKVEKEIAIVNRFGLHLRHAARFAQVANRFRGDIWVAKDGTEILGLITLDAAQGSGLRIRIEGPGAPEAMREIQRLTQSWCDEDRI
jgi:phosphocarrier protein HPr